ncbi:MAG: signal peptide peptidase SppA [Candidatus Methylomirabilales bacterium]
MPAERRRSFLRAVLITGGIGLFFFLLILGVGFLLAHREQLGGPKVALVEVDGIIEESKRVVDQIRHHVENQTVQAFVIRINSPGGGVAASQEIHEEIKKIRQVHGKPVVASFSTVGASGGYYIAAAADKIFANPGSITGSIGVIIQIPNLSDLLRKVGIRSVVIKSGPYKDMASATRELTAGERELLQRLIDDIHDQFIQAVADGRRMSREQVEKVADGRILSGRQALDLGLVDQLGNLQDAIATAAVMGGIPGKPQIVQVKERQFSLLRFLLGSAPAIWRQRILGREGGQFSVDYLWQW